MRVVICKAIKDCLVEFPNDLDDIHRVSDWGIQSRPQV
jgi:hypothetical protein